MRRWIVLVVIAQLAACRTASPRPIRVSDLPFPVDSFRTETLRPGVTHVFLYVPSGPWAIHVLDVDRDRCWSPRAVKSGDRAAGRERTSESLRQLAATAEVAGGVNADFFVTTGPLAGLPLGAFVVDSRVIAGPGAQPVFAIDSTGTPFIGLLAARGRATIGAAAHEITGWNRSIPRGLALFDAAWGPVTDTASATVEVVLESTEGAPGGRDAPRSGTRRYRVIAVDTPAAGVHIPGNGAVLIAGRDAPRALRDAIVALVPGEGVDAQMAISPFHPRTAVGGRPALLRDSAVIPGIDTVGQPGFADGRHPRAAVGVASRGRRLLLVVVDGRQAPYSDGMTLSELAALLRALGAREAINLDGGGSTAFVRADPDPVGTLRVANRPSDPAGERAVGNSLAIVRECAG